jgi:hypothetical protein
MPCLPAWRHLSVRLPPAASGFLWILRPLGYISPPMAHYVTLISHYPSTPLNTALNLDPVLPYRCAYICSCMCTWAELVRDVDQSCSTSAYSYACTDVKSVVLGGRRACSRLWRTPAPPAVRLQPIG